MKSYSIVYVTTIYLLFPGLCPGEEIDRSNLSLEAALLGHWAVYGLWGDDSISFHYYFSPEKCWFVRENKFIEGEEVKTKRALDRFWWQKSWTDRNTLGIKITDRYIGEYDIAIPLNEPKIIGEKCKFIFSEDRNNATVKCSSFWGKHNLTYVDDKTEPQNEDKTETGTCSDKDRSQLSLRQALLGQWINFRGNNEYYFKKDSYINKCEYFPKPNPITTPDDSSSQEQEKESFQYRQCEIKQYGSEQRFFACDYKIFSAHEGRIKFRNVSDYRYDTSEENINKLEKRGIDDIISIFNDLYRDRESLKISSTVGSTEIIFSKDRKYFLLRRKGRSRFIAEEFMYVYSKEEQDKK
ncbi:MAG: hypothetical protein V1789_01600 [PVC group bacterium]